MFVTKVTQIVNGYLVAVEQEGSNHRLVSLQMDCCEKAIH